MVYVSTGTSATASSGNWGVVLPLCFQFKVRGGCICWGNLDHVLMLLLARVAEKASVLCSVFFQLLLRKERSFHKVLDSPNIGIVFTS